METYKALLKQKGVKATDQRAVMLKSIEEAGHADIDAIREKVRLLSPNISLNTIYLNLQQLSNEGIISKVSLNGQKSVYEVTKQPHAHLVCRVCGAVEDKEIDRGLLTAIKEGAVQKAFLPSFIAVNIYGVCKNCQKNNKEENK